MWSNLEEFLYKHGAYWVVALIAVTLSKLYSDEEQSMRSIIRSLLMAIAGTYMGVEVARATINESMLFVYVFVGSFLIDVVAEVLIAVRRKLMSNPEIIIKWFMRGKDK